MNVPEPIHVHTSVNTIMVSESLRPATMKSSCDLICRERYRLKPARTSRYARITQRYQLIAPPHPNDVRRAPWADATGGRTARGMPKIAATRVRWQRTAHSRAPDGGGARLESNGSIAS